MTRPSRIVATLLALSAAALVLAVGQNDILRGSQAMADTEKSYILGKKDNDEFTPIARLVFDADNMPVVTVLNGSDGAAALQSALEEITSRDMLEVDGRREKTDDSGETVIQFIKSQVPKGTEAYSSALRQVLARDYGYTVIHER